MKNKEVLVSQKYIYEIKQNNIELFASITKLKLNLSPIPPTYSTLFRKGEFELLDKIGIQLTQVLHGEQTYEHHKDFFPGQKVSCVSTLKNKLVKKGGSLTILIVTTDIRDEKTDELYVACESTTLVRG